MSKSNKPIITAFKASPDRGKGLARDMRIRWALEELNLPYEAQLFTFEEMAQPAYRKLQPFGQIPAYQEDDLTLFESGAIILYLAEKHPGLLPNETKARARAVTWMFAALNTVEPPIVEKSLFGILERDKPWYKDRLPMLDERVHTRLRELSTYLGDSEWLEAEFTAGDLLMVNVLCRLESSALLDQYPSLAAYVARAKARPAFQRAFAAQLAVYEASLGQNSAP